MGKRQAYRQAIAIFSQQIFPSSIIYKIKYMNTEYAFFYSETIIFFGLLITVRVGLKKSSIENLPSFLVIIRKGSFGMCLISGCVVIDQFTLRLQHAVYILTHWHSDHYQGIMNSWSFGPIYASRVTRNLLLTRFPKLQEKVTELPLRQWINLGQKIEALAFDSNHMAGSIMVILKIEGRFYLHTGDMRFSPKIAENTPEVFQKIIGGYRCKFELDELHLDNTFCDPIFKFPKRSIAIRMLIDLVEELKPKRLYLCTDSVGKEEAFIMVSRYYQMRVAVSSNRYAYIQAMDFNHQQYFTLDPQQTWIEVISKAQKQARLADTKGSIAVTLTGWANLSHSYPDGQNSYLVPYSLHSNFREMQLFVSWTRPKKLIGVVRESEGKWNKISRTNNYKGYMFSLTGVKQRGMQYFRKEYCRSLDDGQQRGMELKGEQSEDNSKNDNMQNIQIQVQQIVEVPLLER